MKTSTKAAVVTVGVAVPAMALGPALFPMSADWPAIEGTQLLLMGGIAAVEALALGLAVAFLLLGWPRVRRLVGPSRPRTTAAYLATAWLLGNWWLHDNLHVANGTNLNGLIAIEYGFHAHAHRRWRNRGLGAPSLPRGGSRAYQPTRVAAIELNPRGAIG
jgi:hypothetical protein